MSYDDLSQEDKNLIDALQAQRDMRLWGSGGYPAEIDFGSIRGYIIIADVDHDESPELTIYRWSDARRWYRRALALLKTCNAEDELCLTRGEPIPYIVAAMNEVEEPRQVGQE